MKIISIPINEISYSKRNFNENDPKFLYLCKSIKDSDLLNPIKVKKEKDHYILIEGLKRLLACIYNDFKTVSCFILDDEEIEQLKLFDNYKYQDLNAIDQANFFLRLMVEHDLTQEEIALRLNYSQSAIANKIRLLRLPDHIKQAIKDAKISERHGRALLKAPDDLIEKIFEAVIKEELTVAKTEKLIKDLSGSKKRLIVNSAPLAALNTIRKAYKLIENSGLNTSYQEKEFEDSYKVIINIKGVKKNG